MDKTLKDKTDLINELEDLQKQIINMNSDNNYNNMEISDFHTNEYDEVIELDLDDNNDDESEVGVGQEYGNYEIEKMISHNGKGKKIQ